MLIGLIVIKPILRLLIGAGPDFNESIGYATSGVNLFYGLLLGLLTVSAYQNSEGRPGSAGRRTRPSAGSGSWRACQAG
jgi:hypothetical protein